MFDEYNDLMTTEEVAEALRLNERTVLKLVREDKLPAVKIANQFRYSKYKMIQWLENEMTVSREPLLNNNYLFDFKEVDMNVLFHYLLKPEHILSDLSPMNSEDLVKILVQKAFKIGLIKEKDKLFESIIERERSYTTAIGKGFALPHPRFCDYDIIERGFVLAGVVKDGIDFNSIDGGLTYIIFLIVVPELPLHLKSMSYFVNKLKNRELFNKILASKSSESIIDLLSHKEVVAN